MNQNKVVLTGNLGIPVEVYIYDDKYMVYHKTLQNVMNVRNISYEFRKMDIENYEGTSTVVCICNMSDPVTKRSVSGVGEASKPNCISEIERKYPVTIAANRAFDRAAIQMLGFKETVYSVSEISILKTIPAKKKTENIQQTASVQENVPVQQNAPVQPTAPAQQPAQTPATPEKKSRPDMPDGISDTIMIGYLKGKSYKEIKDTESITKLIGFLKSHPNLEYPDEAKQKQAEWLRALD